LKKRFTIELIIVVLDLDNKMRMEVDVLNYATGGVLSIVYSNGWWRSVAYLSKSLNKTERNYETHDKEILAVIRRLENWRHLLEGTKFKFEVWINHKNLEYYKSAKVELKISFLGSKTSTRIPSLTKTPFLSYLMQVSITILLLWSYTYKKNMRLLPKLFIMLWMFC